MLKKKVGIMASHIRQNLRMNMHFSITFDSDIQANK